MKKIVKNDEGKIVPEKCDKCGSDVVLQIHGEPVYLCKKCGKYFGTMPCNLKENKNMKKNVVKLNEEQLRKVVAESISSVLKEEYDSFIEDTIGKELSEIEENIDTIEYKLGAEGKLNGGVVHALNGHSSDMQARRTYEAIRMIKRGVNTLRNCTNAY